MCYERFTEKFEDTELRVTQAPREEDLLEPEGRREPTEEPEEVGEREKELAHA